MEREWRICHRYGEKASRPARNPRRFLNVSPQLRNRVSSFFSGKKVPPCECAREKGLKANTTTSMTNKWHAIVIFPSKYLSCLFDLDSFGLREYSRFGTQLAKKTSDVVDNNNRVSRFRNFCFGQTRWGHENHFSLCRLLSWLSTR